ncbi:MAG: acetyl-CoA carboxylase carboxyltransferase subunit alpha [Ignavibacteriales bacterium]|nr:acetyl-CoA carboxylase carboxyltransferase subunit alpha [Ignavibacteriales bacterium]
MTRIVLDFEKTVAELEEKIDALRKDTEHLNLSDDIGKLEKKLRTSQEELYSHLSPWQRVQLARHPERPYTLDYIHLMTKDFIELAGDRGVRDDKAIVGGFARLPGFGKGEGNTVMFIGHQKGRDTKSNVYRNFGMPNPEGYRKALRLMKLAEKFKKPVVTFLDTPGAYPGIEAEERGQAEAIARNIFEMARLQVPIIVVIIGEGASGGALGIGVGDRVLMLENTWYSVISPESCSSILWRSWDFKEKAAEALKLTAPDLLKLKIIDRIVPEPLGGAHRSYQQSADYLKEVLVEELNNLSKNTTTKLTDRRVEKFVKMGVWEE